MPDKSLEVSSQDGVPDVVFTRRPSQVGLGLVELAVSTLFPCGD